MQEIKKRISYVQGLAEGMNLSNETKEGRVINEILTILADMAEDIEEVMYTQAELEEYVENIDQDLNDLEDDVYEEDDDDLETYDDETEYYEDDDPEVDSGEYIEMECPNCQEEVYFESGILEDEDVVEVICPSCDEVIFVNDEEHSENDHQENRSNTEDI